MVRSRPRAARVKSGGRVESMTGDLELQRHAAAEARVGSVLKGKWRLDGLLGVGGMAAVYAATHRNGNRVAIKVLHPEAALIPHVQSRFLREGYLANRVAHPGAVAILDDDVDERGGTFLVLELLEGASLEAVFARRSAPLDEREVLAIAYAVLDVLAVAHDRDIIHRDLKPANVFLERSGALRVLDFGIARLLDPTSGPGETAGQPIGTPGFMPPEQARGRSAEVGRETDIWAVGATLYFLLTGRIVHEGGTVAEQLVAAITQPAPPLAAAAPEVSPSVAAVVDRALAYVRQDRYPDARSMQRDVAAAYVERYGVGLDDAELWAVLSQLAGPQLAPAMPPRPFTSARSEQPTAVGTAHTTPLPASSWRWRYLGGGAAALILVAGTGVLFGPRDPPPPSLAAATPAAAGPLAAAGVAAAVAPSEEPRVLPAASEPGVATSASAAAPGSVIASSAPTAPRAPRSQVSAFARAARSTASSVGPARSATETAPTPSAVRANITVDLFGRRE